VARGERVGLIKFGSRVDVVMQADVKIAVEVGDHVKGASSILAYAPVSRETVSPNGQTTVAGAR
jgi:phosphatidylserine decarboxylase